MQFICSVFAFHTINNGHKMKKLIYVILLSHLIIACGTSYVVNSTSPSYKDEVKEFNDFVLGEEVEITFTNNERINAINVSLSDDTLCWNYPKTKSRDCKPCSEINSIIYKNIWLGGVEGLGIGLLGAGALGFIIGSANPNLDNDWGSGSTAAVYSILGALGGTLIGFTTGMLIGHTREYKFQYEVEMNDHR